MARYYSQRGEDYVLDVIFEGRTDGTFAEIGCIDGRRFSNTLRFEELGWRGLCVEAHTGYIESLRKNRPGSVICHCAVGQDDADEVVFYANARGTLSTLDASQETRWKREFGDHFSGFEEQRVPKRRLDSLFDEHGFDHVDILSVDIEGTEVEALLGMDLKRFRPTAVVVEVESEEQEKRLDELLLPAGYHKSVAVGENVFYLTDPKLGARVENQVFQAQMVHTAHPMDGGEDVVQDVTIDTTRRRKRRRTGALRSLWKKVRGSGAG